jgi:hypothetical protein
MNDSSSEFFSPSKLKNLRRVWSRGDEDKGFTWDFDGVLDTPDNWMGYSQEMSEGLNAFSCKTFDELVLKIKEKKGRKPNVVDLMGGAYFLNNPENANSLTGIRIRNTDEDFLRVYKDKDTLVSKLITKITQSPNRKVIEADILSNTGWEAIKKEDVPLADLLVCRPVGPFDNKRATGNRFDAPEIYGGLYASLFKRMLTLVNRKDGVIFSEVPDIFSDSQIKEFFARADADNDSKTSVFTVSANYQWGGIKRRYVVVSF